MAVEVAVMIGCSFPTAGWLAADAEIALAHELLHLNGSYHGDEKGSAEWNVFVTKERQCSGGRSALPS
jgi:hypothetical protein